MGWGALLALADSSKGQDSGLKIATPIEVNSVGVNLGEFLGNISAPDAPGTVRAPVQPALVSTSPLGANQGTAFLIVGVIALFLFARKKRG